MSQNLELEVQSALNAGNKIAAIKLLREKRGIGLKEAKDIVDAHEKIHGIRHEQSARVESKNSVVLPLLLVLGLLACLIYFALAD